MLRLRCRLESSTMLEIRQVTVRLVLNQSTQPIYFDRPWGTDKSKWWRKDRKLSTYAWGSGPDNASVTVKYSYSNLHFSGSTIIETIICDLARVYSNKICSIPSLMVMVPMIEVVQWAKAESIGRYRRSIFSFSNGHKFYILSSLAAYYSSHHDK
jgi:hypothetical protein